MEKIGAASMSQFKEVFDSIIIGKSVGDELHNCRFVVSAYYDNVINIIMGCSRFLLLFTFLMTPCR